jgi:abortive infection bacteriophage resistance protein
MDYKKPPLTTKQHISQLKLRGLNIPDEQRAENYLDHIGYYRLSAYCLPFETSTANQRIHKFIAGTSFDDILNLYIFDRELRLLIMETIERIEVSVRNQWASELSLKTNDSHAYMNGDNFVDLWNHQRHISKVSSDIKQSKEVFVKHYLNKYEQPFLPPIWAIVETLTLGAFSQWFCNTKDKKLIQCVAKKMGLPTAEIIESVLQPLALIRNICAHHGRLWNRHLVKKVPYIKKLESVLQLQINGAQKQPENTLYNYLVVMSHIMKTIQPTSTWQERLTEKINEATPKQQKSMGFPENWQQLPFWQST